ncbi:energy-coupled thiamine transporter ThiT [Yeguia hominis]|uniref:Energy-coupled thiamine transporter ThiT n=1 Tax=Yeguia hominis TaxID=2763662 RepID=A0A926D9D7_9FIRM|nr:energy-coupled thiamine transporter ThiT [Yeguia hominis]MBC8533782.1 energy-coupled thiamine transporter ThiT [Yeguia hominis]
MEASKTKQGNILRLTESAIMIAFATVLSEIKLLEMPMGGTVTAFSMLPIIIIAYRYGTKWGLLTGVTAGFLQMLLGMQNLKYGATFLSVVCIILFDYLVAFGVQGFGGIFRGKLKYQAAELAAGSVVVGILRFLCHFITGWTIWGVWAPEGMPAWLYSLSYNSTYMVPETIITAVGAALISLVLDFRSRDITRQRSTDAASSATPRSNTAFAAKLTGILSICGGLLYVISSVVYTFFASFTDETIAMPEGAHLLAVIGVTAVIGIVLYALGEVVQILSDLRAGKDNK